MTENVQLKTKGITKNKFVHQVRNVARNGIWDLESEKGKEKLEVEKRALKTSITLASKHNRHINIWNSEQLLPSQNEARILKYTADESLASFEWCLLRIAHIYPLVFTNKILPWQNYQLDCIPHYFRRNIKENGMDR